MIEFILILFVSIYFIVFDIRNREIPIQFYRFIIALTLLYASLMNFRLLFSNITIIILFVLNFFLLFFSCISLYLMKLIGGGDSKYIYILYLFHFGLKSELISFAHYFFILFFQYLLFYSLNYLYNRSLFADTFKPFFLNLNIKKKLLKFNVQMSYRVFPLSSLKTYNEIKSKIKNISFFYNSNKYRFHYIAQYKMPLIGLCFSSYLCIIIF